MPSPLSSLLKRLRTGMLMLLLVVLPLQSVMQFVAGLQAHRHMHSDAAHAVASPSPLRLLLDRLHAVQDPRLQFTGRVAGGELHEHGGVFHRHTHDTADVIDASTAADDAARDAAQGGATAFLAWLPGTLTLPTLAAGSGHPAVVDLDWRDRVVAPPLTPPRG